MISFCLSCMALLGLPKRHGRSTEFRNSVLTILPIGHSRTLENGTEFYERAFVVALKTEFAGKGLRFSRGSISFYVFPQGWGIPCCLYEDSLDKIRFFWE